MVAKMLQGKGWKIYLQTKSDVLIAYFVLPISFAVAEGRGFRILSFDLHGRTLSDLAENQLDLFLDFRSVSSFVLLHRYGVLYDVYVF